MIHLHRSDHEISSRHRTPNQLSRTSYESEWCKNQGEWAGVSGGQDTRKRYIRELRVAIVYYKLSERGQTKQKRCATQKFLILDLN